MNFFTGKTTNERFSRQNKYLKRTNLPGSVKYDASESDDQSMERSEESEFIAKRMALEEEL